MSEIIPGSTRQLEEDWDQLLTLRDEVLKVLEEARTAKTISNKPSRPRSSSLAQQHRRTAQPRLRAIQIHPPRALRRSPGRNLQRDRHRRQRRKGSLLRPGQTRRRQQMRTLLALHPRRRQRSQLPHRLPPLRRSPRSHRLPTLRRTTQQFDGAASLMSSPNKTTYEAATPVTATKARDRRGVAACNRRRRRHPATASPKHRRAATPERPGSHRHPRHLPHHPRPQHRRRLQHVRRIRLPHHRPQHSHRLLRHRRHRPHRHALATGRALTLSSVALALILGGAVGNLYDRIRSTTSSTSSKSTSSLPLARLQRSRQLHRHRRLPPPHRNLPPATQPQYVLKPRASTSHL